MARIRTIKPEFFKHEGLYDLEAESGLPVRLAFAGLWTQCDREGRFEWRPRQLKTDLLPYDDVDFSRVLHALATRGFVVRYEVGSKTYGFIPSWRRHQVVNNREGGSEIPDPPKDAEEKQRKDIELSNASSTRNERVDNASPTRGARLYEFPCVEGERERELEGEAIPPPSRYPARSSGGDDLDEDDLDEVHREVCRLAGIDPFTSIRPVRLWLASGLDPERDIYPCVAAVMAHARQREGQAWTPINLTYFDRPMQRWLDDRHGGVEPLRPRPNGGGNGSHYTGAAGPGFEDSRTKARKRWNGPVTLWLNGVPWDAEIHGGQAPGQPGSEVPEWLIAECEERLGKERPEPVKGIE